MTSTVPSIAAKPACPEQPLTVEVKLTVDDWAQAILYSMSDVFFRDRRQSLTILLPTIWIGLLAFAFMRWTDGERDTSFLQNIVQILSTPFGWLFALAPVVIAGLAYLIHPWRMHRRFRRHLRDNGFNAEIPVVYRFDSTGITRSEPNRSSFAPWSRIGQMHESDTHLFFATDPTIEPFVLPKRGLSEIAATQARRWSKACIGEASTGMKAPTVEKPSGRAIQLSFTLNAGDRAAVLVKQGNRPAATRRRIVVLILATIGLSLMTPIAFAIGWIVDPHRVPLAIAFPLYLEMIVEALLSFWVWSAMLAALLFLVYMGARRAGAYYMARQFHAKARSDPTEVTIDESGIVAAQGGALDKMEWSCFRRIERSRNHIFLPVSCGSMVLLPLRSFDEEALGRFNVLAERLGS